GCFYFFFQAEDGIRDLTVTGVQTCALPIFETAKGQLLEVVGTYDQEDVAPRSLYAIGVTFEEQGHYDSAVVYYRRILKDYPYSRSEERRVGKECRSRGTRDIYKDKCSMGRM